MSASAADGPLRAMRWLAPGADRTRALANAPAECLHVPKDPDAAFRVEVGRAAFRTPLLLGGQAARAGIACESCHRSGRGNPDFSFPGVSGAPGTADVTSSLFSSHRGDGTDNPKPIPDLGGPKARLKVSQAPEGQALEGFIHGLVTEEFDGAEPAPGAIDGLAAYVRSLSPQACGRPARLTARTFLDDARRAVRTARQALSRGEPGLAGLMIASARARLGLIHERYGAPGLEADRRALLAADGDLAEAAGAIRAGRPDADRELRRWLARSGGLERTLERDRERSLFNPARLAGA